MKDIYLRTPNGLVPLKYEPKRIWHFHIFEVFILMGLGALIGVLSYEYIVHTYLPKPPCSTCVCEKIKGKIARMK
jgi:hypothetical protein